MSYDIYIGNAEPAHDGESFDWVVKPFYHEDAPEFVNDSMTGKENHRHPAYIAWAETLRDAGLHDLFFKKWNGLMSAHPGIKPITDAHVMQVESALEQFRQKYPNAIPRFGGIDFQTGKPKIEVQDEDVILARLIWLAWWMRWAVRNCEYPAIYNY